MARAYDVYAKARNEKGLTDYAVSKVTGIATSTLTDWKKGRYVPKANKLILLAKALDIPLESFYTEET